MYKRCAYSSHHRVYRTCTLWADHTAVLYRRAAGRLGDQMSSPGDYLPVSVGLAFGIAPCGELWAKEFGGGAEVRAAFAYKMAAYILTLHKKIAARHKGEGRLFFIAKGGAARKKHQDEMRENQPT